jgi:hypothetical protein
MSKHGSNEKPIIVDGSNVAYEGVPKGSKPELSNILAVRKALEKRGYDPVIIVDAALHHTVDQPGQIEHLIGKDAILQAPAGTDADYFILETADRMHAQVVSNDEYRPYRDRFPWVNKRRVPFMIIDGQVELYQPDLKSADQERYGS